jgi:hypothetical protein
MEVCSGLIFVWECVGETPLDYSELNPLLAYQSAAPSEEVTQP